MLCETSVLVDAGDAIITPQPHKVAELTFMQDSSNYGYEKRTMNTGRRIKSRGHGRLHHTEF
jgi:hypothetical protein